MADYALSGANAISLPREDRQSVHYAAILHDIGKLGAPNGAPQDADNLTEEQQAALRKHPIRGYNLLLGIPFLRDSLKPILHHHERYDGRGYPKRLKQEDIPIGASLIAVADAYDNLTTERPSSSALGRKEALAELQKYAGLKFDPLVVKAFTTGLLNAGEDSNS